MNIELIEISGLASALKAMRLPHNGEPKSEIETHVYTGINSVNHSSTISLRDKDLTLMGMLVSTGDSDAKCVRGILAYLDITATIDWWVELETYRMGHERLSSASTMHSELKKLTGHALEEEVAKIPYDRNIRKIDYFSYQCLRNMFKQRFNHRKPQWHLFFEEIKKLPLANELIFVGLDTEMEVHNDYVRRYQNNEI